ncbi:MAG: hypothetical protein NDJ89_08480 [Oligoflexia bacterium]|nr:hypothetical protein [Oligoflexia bacterium]
MPIHVLRQPPSDLLTPDGKPIDPGQAISAALAGTDLSRLDPVPSKLWQNRSYSPGVTSEENSRFAYPKDGGTVLFVRAEASNVFTSMARVRNAESPGIAYRLGLSRNTHSMLLRTALMRTLGYYVPSPRFYSRLTVSFTSKEELENFARAAQEDVGVDLEKNGWLTARDPERLTLTFGNATLEPALAEYFDAHWAFLPPATSRTLPMIRQLSRYRAYRALLIPLVLVDIDESINRFSPKVRTGIINDQVVLTHASARSLSAATYEDARWMVRKLARLSRAQLRRIVEEARLPEEIAELVARKLVYRIFNLLELFDVRPETDLEKLPLRYDSPSGLIRQGIITQERVPGYPQRFAHGDRKRPFDQGDLQRYIGIEAITSVLKDLLARINEKLAVQDPSDLAEKRQEQVLKRIQDHIRRNPREPLYQKVESWGGPIGSATLSASRHVTTGTYFGSTAPIQLVDDLTLGGSVGYFRALDGYSGYLPSAGGNVSLLRSYTHVRPLASLEEGTKVKWSNLFVPKFMKDLGRILEKDAPAEGPHPLDEFLGGLKDGEIFTITDSLGVDAYLQNVSPLNVLAGFDPLGFLTTVSVGVDAGLVGLRQTVFARTGTGLQVYVRGMDNRSVGAQLDANFFLNILKARAERTRSNVVTDAYVIEYNDAIASLGDGATPPEKLRKRRDDLHAALRLLFRKNDSSLFESSFADRRFELEHALDTRSTSIKLLTERMNGFSESHELALRYPANPDYPELDPNDEEVTLYTYKKGQLIGRDLLGSVFDLFEALFKKPGLVARVNNPNPANLPFGKAYWRIVNTEADLTAQGDRYPSVGIVQHVWGGWHLKHPELLELVDGINAQFARQGLQGYRLAEPEFFATTQSLDYYRITQNISLLQGGLERVRDLLLLPGAAEVAQPKYRGLFPRLFAALTRRGAKGNAWDKTDPVFFREMMKLIGRGDQAHGERFYAETCRAELAARNPENPNAPGAFWFHGNSYECLTPWMMDLMKLRRRYDPEDRRSQTRWMTEALALLEANVQLSTLLDYVGSSNYSMSVRFNGFRTGDEDGDLEFISNTSGDPAKDFETANGLFQLYAGKTGIMPVELDRSNGSFR